MDRREFFSRFTFGLAAIPLLGSVVPSSWSLPRVDPVPNGPTVLDPNGVYQYAKAMTPLRVGQPVYWIDGGVAGIPTCDVDAGNYGFIQVSSPRSESSFEVR